MKVALSFPACNRRGGVERVMHECARFLSRRGHEVTIVAGDWDEALPGVRYHRIALRRRPKLLQSVSYFNAARRALMPGDYDVINTHGAVCPGGGVQWVHSLHAAWLDRSRSFRKAFSKPWIKQHLNPLHPILLRFERYHFGQRRYRKLTATTEQVKSDLMHYYNVPAEDVEIVPNGFEPEEFSPDRRLARRADARKHFGVGEDDVVLLLVANELERKGYPVILESLRKLQDKRLKLLVVGKPSPKLVKRMADQQGVADRVIAAGPSSDVSFTHAASDCLVLPTQYEAFCLAILEALGSGLPVITSNVPGARDAIVPGTNGLLINDPTDSEALAHALAEIADDQTRHRLTSAAAESVRQYQWPVTLQKYEQVLAENCRS